MILSNLSRNPFQQARPQTSIKADWSLSILLNRDLRIDSVCLDGNNDDFDVNSWIGSWIDDVFRSEEGDTFISSSLISNLDVSSFEINLSLKNHPSVKTRAQVKRLTGRDNYGFYIDCKFTSGTKDRMPVDRTDLLDIVRENSTLCICDLDFDSKNFEISIQLWQILGYHTKALDVSLNSFKELFHPDDLSFFDISYRGNWGEVIEGNFNFRQELRLKHAEGVYRWVEAFGVKYQPLENGKGRICAVFQDVTIRKLIEENFRESEERFNHLLNSKNIGFFDCNLATDRGFISPILKRMLGYNIGDLSDDYEQLEELIHFEDKGDSKIDYDDDSNNVRRTFVRECRMRKNDGTYMWVQINGLYFLNAKGGVDRKIGFLTNIENKKEAEIALSAEQERLRVTLSSIKDAVIATNNDGNVVLFNRTAELWFGVTAEEVMDKPIPKKLFITNPKTRAPFPIDDALKVGDGPIDDFKFKGVIFDPAGNEIILSRSYAPLKDEGGHVIGTVLIYHDITSSERYAHEMIKSSKMESIGMLAGGIAHDFNNLLTTILGNISLVQNNFSGIEVLEQSEEACLMAKELTQQLLTFAKGGAPIKKVVSVKELSEKSVKLALTGSNVEPTFNFSEDNLSVEVDPSQMNQVIQNLTINAAQAMPDGGHFSVKVDLVNLTDDSHLPLAEGAYVVVKFEDTGLGIPDENLQKIFDPFFSTKNFGSGLGLTTSYSIVKRHYGHIEVRSEIGVGTKFNIYLPATTRMVEPEIEEEVDLTDGNGKVLIMDDDSSIREVAKLILERLGYIVTGSTKGEEAIELYKAAMGTPEAFDLVIMDLTIPGYMGGKDTIKELLLIDPEVKGIVSSGYSTDPIMANFESYGFKGVVEKPFRVDELGKAIQKVLVPKEG